MAKKVGGGKGKNGKDNTTKNMELLIHKRIKNKELLEGEKPQFKKGEKFADVLKSKKTDKKFAERIKSEKNVNERKKDTQKPVAKKVKEQPLKSLQEKQKTNTQKPQPKTATPPAKKEGKMKRLMKSAGKLSKSVATKNPIVKAGVAIGKEAKQAFLKKNGHISKNKPDNSPAKTPSKPKPSAPRR